MGLFSKKIIKVVFQVERTGEKLGFDEIPLNKIPESWKYSTTVTVNSKEWDVVRVSPEKRKEMITARSLTVTVRRPDNGKDHQVVVEQTTEPAKEEVSVTTGLEIPVEEDHSDDSTVAIESPAELVSEESVESVEVDPEEISLEPIDLTSALSPEITTENESPEVDEAFESIPEIKLEDLPDSESEQEKVEYAEDEVEADVLLMEDEPEDWDPNEIALPFPTISGKLPETTEVTAENPFVIHGDLWRQIEFVDGSREEAMRKTFSEINQVYENHCFFRRGKRYFRDLYMRSEWNAPISATIPLSELKLDFFPGSTEYDGVVIEGQGQVVDGFAFLLGSGFILYGVAIEGTVSRLGLAGTTSYKLESLLVELDSLTTLMKDYGLVLVDWLEQTKVVPEKSDLKSFFTGGDAD